MQVLDEIVQMLTEERFMGKMVVILAGYEQQVGAARDTRQRSCVKRCNASLRRTPWADLVGCLLNAKTLYPLLFALITDVRPRHPVLHA